MLITLNNNGNLQIGILKSKYKKELKDYRNSLLQKTEYNFDINSTFVEREYGRLDNTTKYKVYNEGEILVQESCSDFLRVEIPFETYKYLFKKTNIKCNSLITIQILTRILNDWYDVENMDIVSDFVKLNIMNLLIKNPKLSVPIQDYSNSHIGIQKLIESDREIDLNSFRNSFPLIEYVIYNEYSLNEINELEIEEIEKKFNINLFEIMANTKVLYGDNVRTLNKIKQFRKN